MGRPSLPRRDSQQGVLGDVVRWAMKWRKDYSGQMPTLGKMRTQLEGCDLRALLFEISNLCYRLQARGQSGRNF